MSKVHDNSTPKMILGMYWGACTIPHYLSPILLYTGIYYAVLKFTSKLCDPPPPKKKKKKSDPPAKTFLKFLTTPHPPKLEGGGRCIPWVNLFTKFPESFRYYFTSYCDYLDKYPRNFYPYLILIVTLMNRSNVLQELTLHWQSLSSID